MKEFVLILTLIKVALLGFGQITTTKVAPRSEDVNPIPFDSSVNFFRGEPEKYIGQKLYLKGESESLREYGYSGFIIDINYKGSKATKNIYACCDGNGSKYDDLVGKYFTVIDVLPDPAGEIEVVCGKVYYLKLREESSGDLLYYRYTSNCEFKFPFIMVAYYEKLKNTRIGNKYSIRGWNWISRNEEMQDMETGKPVSFFYPGPIWTCVDVSVEERFYNLALILENEKGEKIPLGVEYEDDNNTVLNATNPQYYIDKYGLQNWKNILEGKAVIGMSQEMCRLSWGDPDEINKTTTADGTSEQWVYESNYLYFDNGKLTAVQKY